MTPPRIDPEELATIIESWARELGKNLNNATLTHPLHAHIVNLPFGDIEVELRLIPPGHPLHSSSPRKPST